MQFSGSFVAITTPFTADGESVDFKALKALIEWHIAQGTNGIVPCGTTGESATFSHQEQAEVIRFVVETVAGRIPVIAGAGSNSTREAVELACAATAAGANGILTITPYYNRPNQRGLYEHFRAVRECTSLPLVLYNVPSRTGTNLLPETAIRVAELGGIAAVKEASGKLEQVQELLDAGIGVLSGDDALTWPMMAMGAQGVISVVANIDPAAMAKLCRAALAGDLTEARRCHGRIAALSKLAFMDTNPIPAKTALAAMGRMNEVFRLPLVPMTNDARNELLAGLQELEVL
ncbi:MAG: 4-hydroxy-tetrahydrodipicolinate synthase [Planctomycetota bacterium]|nr:MAG: 4-hydroxy-tetrahydrodipicolinate synthase [Planctomycetota bacterium]